MKKFIVLTIIFASITGVVIYPVLSEAQDMWSDTFADTSLIQSSDKVIQTSETTEFGKNFTLYPGNPLLSLETSDPWDANGDVTKQIPGAVHADVLYFPGDGIGGYKFWMVFTPAPETGSVPPGGSGSPDYWWERPTLVRSNDGINWEKTSDYTNPVASPGPAGAWDSGWLADPDFVYAPGKGPNGEDWFLYYTGCGGGGCAIDLSLSFDGKHWMKYSTSGPIAPAYRCPAVIYDKDTGIFHMWYNWGSFEIGYATSTDGINWIPYNPTNPGQWGYIVFRGTPGMFDQGGVTHMDVIYHDGKYWMYYLALPTSSYAGLVVGLATSPDGYNWTKHPQPVITPGGQTWNFTGVVGPRTVQSLYRPSAVVVGDTMYLYYGGTDDYVAYPAHNYEMGVAFSTQTPPDGYVELDRYLLSSEYSSRPDETMAWYHMNEGSYTPIYPGEYSSQTDTLAWYHFNEGSGTSTSDSGGSIQDNGTLNSPTWTTGLYGAGLSFDGNDRITVPNSSELNPTDALTIEAWVRPSVSKENNYVAIKMTPGTGDYVYGLKIDNSQIWAFIAVGGTLYWSHSSNLVPINSWTHIAMSYEKSLAPTSIKLYMNGVEVSYSQFDSIPANTSIPANSGPLNIGLIPIGSPIYYEGVMDEVRILGRALTAVEIAADGAVTASLVLDSSGNNNHGTPSGGVASTTGKFSTPGISFNGTNGYFSAQHHESLNTEEEVTIEAWVNPSIDKSNNYVVIKMVPASLYTYSYGLKLESQYAGYSEIGGVIQGSGGQQYFAYGGHVPTGEWTHIAMTYKMDPTNNTHIRLFQNGVEVAYRYGALNAATDTIPSNTLIRTHAGPLVVGVIPVNSPPSGAFFFNGAMDEVRILRQALTPDEILIDYGEGYEPSGNLTSVLIEPPEGKGWDKFFASDERPEGTNVLYSILGSSGNVLLSSVGDGADISSLGDTPIRLYAELMTSDPVYTPFVDAWAVSWKQLNRAPVLDPIGAKTVNEGTLLTFTATASDPDVPANTLTFSLVGGAPAGASIGPTSGAFTWAPTEAQSGSASFTVKVCDNGSPVLCDEETITVTVNEVNEAPVLATIGNKEVQWSDKLTFTATATDPDIPVNILTFSLVSAPKGASFDESSHVFSWIPTEEQPSGTYNVTVKVCDDGTPSKCDDETITISVNPEDALAWFDPDNPVAVQVVAPGGASGEIILIVDVRETQPDLPDGLGAYGDINLAQVSMTLQPVGPGSPVSGSCTPPDSEVEPGYDAVLSVTCSFSDVPVNTYTVQVTVNGGYYTGGGEDVLVVYDPSLGFATGGGWFYWPDMDDPDTGYPGDKTNFGFTMKYNKKGTNMQGSLLLIRHVPDEMISDGTICDGGLVYNTIYRVKSNALYWLTLGDTGTYGWASFSGKATYLDPCMPEPKGSYEFIVYVEDRNEPGKGIDRFWIQIKDQYGVVIGEMSMPPGATLPENNEDLQGGNIVVPHR